MNKEIKGAATLVLTTMIYGSYGVFSRFIGEYFGTFSQNWIRNFIVVLLVFLILKFKREKLKKINKVDRLWIILWLLAGSMTMVMLFMAFNNLPLSTVYFLFYSTMIISGFVCGKLFFKEKLNKVKIVSMILALMGLYLVYSFSIDEGKLIYILMTLLTGLLLGFWNTISKKFSDNYSNLQVVFYDGIFSGLISLIMFGIVGETQTNLDNFNMGWVWMLAYAVAQILTIGMLVYGFKNLEAQIGSVIMPVEVIFASIFSYLIFKEMMTMQVLTGGILIASAAFLPSVVLLGKKREIKGN